MTLCPWKYMMVSLLIGFFLGAAGGLLGAHCLHARWMRHSPEALVQRFNKELQLTDNQRTQILAILKANREKLQAYKQEVRQAAHTEIRKLLTSTQQVRFDALEARWRRLRGRRSS